MNFESMEKLVHASLYEGYILYPYRPTSVKNKVRWLFGGLYPKSYVGEQLGSESSKLVTQCLLEGGKAPSLTIKARFLHLTSRSVCVVDPPVSELLAKDEHLMKPVDMLRVEGRVLRPWEESVEREIAVDGVGMGEKRRVPFTFAASRTVEPVKNASGQIVGALVRVQHEVNGVVEVDIARVEGAGVENAICKMTVSVENLTALDAGVDRDAAMLRTFASSHVMMGVEGSGFVSMTDPPAHLAEMVGAFVNQGAWPVLIGQEGERSLMLSSPIIFSDYPQIAPESPNDLFDACEIDEILTLRIMTLTDDEKREMAAVDPRARELLEKTELMGAEQLKSLHGAMRGHPGLGGPRTSSLERSGGDS